MSGNRDSTLTNKGLQAVCSCHRMVLMTAPEEVQLPACCQRVCISQAGCLRSVACSRCRCTCIEQEQCHYETARLTHMVQMQQHRVLFFKQSSAAERLASWQKGQRCGFCLTRPNAQMKINICRQRQRQDSWNT